MKFCVTGCAGFIGSNLTDRLLSAGHTVVGIDNFSSGQNRFLKNAYLNPNFSLIKLDLLDMNSLTNALTDCDAVYHFAANADVRFGTDHP